MSVRRSGCFAVLLLASGLYGCKTENADQEAPAQENPPQEDAGYVPADDDFKHAYVLATDDAPVETSSFRQTMSLQSSISLASSASPSGWTPQQFQQAYNVPASIDNKPAGYGVKVAVIAAYHYSNLQYDLNKWAAQYNQKPITLHIINQAGNVSNSNMSLQSSLSVQMINAISPGATVYVIEAKSVSQTDMLTALKTAANLGVNVILMPFGAPEYSTEGAQAHLFLNSQIVWVAATGNDDEVYFPASSPDVVAVGGTTPVSGTPLVEAAWVNAGAGISFYESMPSYQKITSVQKANTTAFRSLPDVAFNANPSYGARVYCSILGGWYVTGGTSVSAAFFAGAVAIANQARENVNKPMLSSVSTSHTSVQKALYQLSANAGPNTPTVLNDVVDGHAGGYPTGPGYDIATGLGSLDVQNFVDYMTNY